MGRALESPARDDLTAHLAGTPINRQARVVYFPVRHHSPACAWHVRRLIRELRPEAVLIEGPRDATRLIPLLFHPQTRMPVAVYTTYVERAGTDAPPRRHAAYYPLCDYAPEWVALQTAREVGARAAFIDLTFPEMVRAGRLGRSRSETPGAGQAAAKAQSLLEENALRYSRFLKAACRRAGVRDPDELWDHLYEVDYRDVETGLFMQRVLAYCALARQDYTPDMLAADATLAREAAMAAAIAQEKGRVVVVTGGFHTVALPATKPAAPEPVKTAPEDALVVLMRYGFEQLDRLNGYASGMPSPEFYQCSWDQRDLAEVFVELGRECRRRKQDISVADEIGALDQCRRLAQLRGHGQPSRMDVWDGVRSALVKGAADAEGLLVLAVTRKFLAGDRVGNVPREAGQPPLVADFRDTAQRLNIELDRIEAKECSLDLYRRTAHREMSRFFYRLRFLEVPFAGLVRGPDFVAGTGLERIQEVWKYHWSPECESVLIERSLYGSSVEEAAAGLLVERFAGAEAAGQGRRADVGAALLLEACRMGLHRHTPDLLRRTAGLIADDASFVSLVRAMESLLVLHVSREPLEAHRLEGILELAGQAYDRAAFLLPQLAATPSDQESEVIDALHALSQAALTVGQSPARQQLRQDRLRDLLAATPGSAAMHGAAAGLLFGEGCLVGPELPQLLRGHLLSGSEEGFAGCNFLRGLMRTARSVLWQVPEVIGCLHEQLREWDEAQFVRLVPRLRLALADLTPRESDQIARAVAVQAGVKKFEIAVSSRFSAGDMALAVDIHRRMAQTLRRDGLALWLQEEPDHAG